jgi:mRNA interferase RelE/StbE
MPANQAALVLSKLTELARNPLRPNRNVKRLVHSGRWRLRIGDWRVIYEIETNRLLIFVIKIGPRGSVYDD